MAMFARPVYRAIEYTRISEGFYGATAAWEMDAHDAGEAMDWCEERSAALSAEPHRIELYACSRLHDHLGEQGGADLLALLIRAWDHGTRTVEDSAGHIVEIQATGTAP